MYALRLSESLAFLCVTLGSTVATLGLLELWARYTQRQNRPFMRSLARLDAAVLPRLPFGMGRKWVPASRRIRSEVREPSSRRSSER
jgi:hypothetical protein